MILSKFFQKILACILPLHSCIQYLFYSIIQKKSCFDRIESPIFDHDLTNDLTDLVKIKGALVSPNDKNLKKSMILPLVTWKNRETSDEVKKYQYCDIRSLDQF